jgi:superfamily II DNA or RNA helicase
MSHSTLDRLYLALTTDQSLLLAKTPALAFAQTIGLPRPVAVALADIAEKHNLKQSLEFLNTKTDKALFVRGGVSLRSQTVRVFLDWIGGKYLKETYPAEEAGGAAHSKSTKSQALGDLAPAPTAEQLLKWIADHGLVGFLDLPVAHLIRTARDTGLNTRDFLQVAQKDPKSYDNVVVLLQNRFQTITDNLRYLSNSQLEPDIVPDEFEHPWQPFWKKVQRAHQVLQALSLARPKGTFLPEPLALSSDEAWIEYRETNVVVGRTPNIYNKYFLSLKIDHNADTALSWRCECVQNGGPPCCHLVAAVEQLETTLRCSRAENRAALMDSLSLAPAQRFSRAFAKAAIFVPPFLASEPTFERLDWRIRADSLSPLEPVIKKLTPKGSWSVGSAKSAAVLRSHSVWASLSEKDKSICDWLALSQYSAVTEMANTDAMLRAFDNLVGAPNVEFEYAGPVLLCNETLFVHFAEEDDLYGLHFEVGGQPVDVNTLFRSAMGKKRMLVRSASGTRCYLVPTDPALSSLIQVAMRFGQQIDRSAAEDVVFALQGSACSLNLDRALSLAGHRVKAETHLIATITPLGDMGISVKLSTRPANPGPSFTPGQGPVSFALGQRHHRTTYTRDLLVETLAAKRLLESLPLAPEAAKAALDSGCNFSVLDPSAALGVLGALAERESEVQTQWPKDVEAISVRKLDRHKFEMAVKSAGDWLEFSGDVQCDEHSISLADLLLATRRKQKFVQLTPKLFLRIDESIRRALNLLGDICTPTKQGLEISSLAAGLLPELLSELPLVQSQQTSTTLTAMKHKIVQANEMEVSVPVNLEGTLRTYQRLGYEWLSRTAHWSPGACLADEMGLGKTIQSLAFVLSRSSTGPSLVVAPTSVTSNWQAESKRFAPSLRTRLIMSGADLNDAHFEPMDLVVLSYDVLARNVQAIQTHAFSTAIFDEAHYLKNSSTQRARAACGVNATFRLLLTGTPIENRLSDLWSLFRVAVPTLFGSADAFKERFVIPIERERDSERAARLNKLVSPFILRRRLREVELELPERTDVVHRITLSAAERRLYEKHRLAAIQSLGAKRADTSNGPLHLHLLAALTKLRQLACHSALVVPEAGVSSSKLDALMQILTDSPSDCRTLVFSQFTSLLDLVEPALARAKIPWVRLDGTTPAAERQARIAEFSSGAAQVFLISLRAGGTGLNLTEAQQVILLDPWWNPAVEDQAAARAHRIGQSRHVTVIRLVAEATIEERVLSLHEDKRALATSVLEGTSGSTGLSAEDLLSLLSSEDELNDPEVELPAMPDLKHPPDLTAVLQYAS